MGRMSSGRLHWLLEDGPSEHVLDIKPDVVGPVRLVLDGRTVGSMPKPSPVQPWVEHQIAVDDRTFTVALMLDPPTFAVDVFGADRSLLDDRRLDAVRAEAPRAVSRFEHWTNPGVSGIAELQMAPRWSVVLFVLSILLLSVVIFIVRAGPVAGGLGAVGLVALYVVLLRIWLIAIARTRLALIKVEGMGDYMKVALFFISVALGGIAVFLTWFGTVLLLAAIQDLVRAT